MNPPRRGFSLLELLTVTGVLAVLAAVLYPVIARARVEGQGAVALAHLRQIGVASALYRLDHEGVFVLPRVPLGPRRYAYWWALYDEVTQERDERRGLLSPYSRGAGIQRDTLWNDRSRYALGFTGFAYNYRYFGSGLIPDTAVSQPAQTVEFATSARVGFLPPHRLEGNAYLEPPSSRYPTFHARRGERGLVCWSDLHVTSRVPTPHLVRVGDVSPSTLLRLRLGEIDGDGDLSTDDLFDLR